MWPNSQETPDLATFTVEILNGKLHFLCSGKRGILEHKWLVDILNIKVKILET